MTPVDRGRLDRATRGLTIGVPKSQEQFLKEQQTEALGEVEEQFQIKLSGRAEEFPIWDQVDVGFDTRFVDATGQRPSPFDRPHMLYGYEISTPNPVGIFVCVLQWKLNKRNETVGARLGLGVAATDLSTKFKGAVHVTFQGYGAPAENYGEQGLDNR